MEDNKELVTDVTENVEQATEELVDGAKTQETTEEVVNAVDEATADTKPVEEKLYSESELNQKLDELLADKIGKKTAIIKRQLRREYDEKYGELENVLKAGTGESDIKTITDTFTDFYTKKGINIPQRANYNESDLKILANAEADDIINSSFNEVVEETDRLADKGLDNMSPREKIVFKKLAEYRKSKERENELASIGAMKVTNDKEFNDFASQFNSNVPIKTVYEMYTKTRPQPKVEQIGSMKSTVPNKTKDYYTPDEVDRLTPEQLRDPKIMDAVDNSMKIWYEKGIH
jgi:transcriptional regulator of heat shock response